MRFLALALGLTIAGAGAAAAQDDYPNLVGTWTGTADQVVINLDGSGGTFQAGAISLVVSEQQDRRFYGTINVVEGQQTLKLAIAGVFVDETQFRWAEPAGEVEGRMVDLDTFNACYLRISTFSQIAACETLTRQP